MDRIEVRKVELEALLEKNQINTDLELLLTWKQTLNFKPYKDNNGEEI